MTTTEEPTITEILKRVVALESLVSEILGVRVNSQPGNKPVNPPAWDKAVAASLKGDRHAVPRYLDIYDPPPVASTFRISMPRTRGRAIHSKRR